MGKKAEKRRVKWYLFQLNYEFFDGKDHWQTSFRRKTLRRKDEFFRWFPYGRIKRQYETILTL